MPSSLKNRITAQYIILNVTQHHPDIKIWARVQKAPYRVTEDVAQLLDRPYVQNQWTAPLQ